jgi:hypothetical protein
MEVMMKKLHAVCVALVIIISPLVGAEEETTLTPRFVRATLEQSEQSLLTGLDGCSDANMLSSAANTMRQLKELYPERTFTCFVIPLMRIVKDEDLDACTRVTAAIALHSLNSERGDFAIKRAAQFTGSERVRHICTWLTYYHDLGERAPTISEHASPLHYVVEPLSEFNSE